MTPAQEAHILVGTNHRECHKNSQRAGEPLLRKQAETVGFVHPGEEIFLVCSSRETLKHLPVPKGDPRPLERDFLQGLRVIRQGGIV